MVSGAGGDSDRDSGRRWAPARSSSTVGPNRRGSGPGGVSSPRDDRRVLMRRRVRRVSRARPSRPVPPASSSVRGARRKLARVNRKRVALAGVPKNSRRITSFEVSGKLPGVLSRVGRLVSLGRPVASRRSTPVPFQILASTRDAPAAHLGKAACDHDEPAQTSRAPPRRSQRRGRRSSIPRTSPRRSFLPLSRGISAAARSPASPSSPRATPPSAGRRESPRRKGGFFAKPRTRPRSSRRVTREERRDRDRGMVLTCANPACTRGVRPRSPRRVLNPPPARSPRARRPPKEEAPSQDPKIPKKTKQTFSHRPVPTAGHPHVAQGMDPTG